MWPHSLLFSSDEEASRALSRAFRDLEFEVETCPEIFSAVEKITRRSFDVVVSDWNEGLGSRFPAEDGAGTEGQSLRVYHCNCRRGRREAAREAGADLVLSRPLVPDQVKYALLNSDAFLVQMKSWLPRTGQTPVGTAPPKLQVTVPASRLRAGRFQKAISCRSLRRICIRESGHPLRLRARKSESAAPLVAAESIFDDALLHQSRVGNVSRVPEPSFSSSTTLSKKTRSRVLPGLAIAVAFLSVGYVFSEPLRGQGTRPPWPECTGACWNRRKPGCTGPTRATLRRPRSSWPRMTTISKTRISGRAVEHVRVSPVKQTHFRMPAPNQRQCRQSRVEAGPANQQPPAATTAVRHSGQFENPVQSASMRSVARSRAVASRRPRTRVLVRGSFPPVAAAEGSAQLSRTGGQGALQGPVVLQAWIGRDGTIQDLKLVRGSFLLGQAAYRAVKQWRYQPYW